MIPAGPAAARGAAPRPRVTFIGATMLIFGALVIGSWVFVLSSDSPQTHSYFSSETFSRAWGFLKDLLGLSSSATPAFMQPDKWLATSNLARKTLAMSVLGIGLAGLVHRQIVRETDDTVQDRVVLLQSLHVHRGQLNGSDLAAPDQLRQAANRPERHVFEV